MIDTVKIKDKVKLKDSRVLTVHKIYTALNETKKLYGLGLDPEHPGNFEWYYESGKPVTWWANEFHSKHIIETKTIVEIVRD